ncbi:hypothetical protein BO221_04210 [Archangium sp. Cb G35]|uniref:hypothetical protein n=1 Tax=Archangium sp. Cb G35 TaxID=1920190 RepID=UPI00093770BB|nr:hypothetical protein [Archangium sp. Cb G35]OJT27202.1 hypothetical protein BO221_04210 [Archangium sp. Cb G35]
MHERLPPPSVAPQMWETLSDAEQVFTVAMPRGWRNRAWVQSNGSIPHQLATAESPTGGTTLFLGDPTIPMFIEPAATMFGSPPGAVARPYTSIEHFLPAHAQYRFGGLPGFRWGAMVPSPELFQRVSQLFQRSGAAQAWVTAGRITFSFDEGPRRVQAVLFGSSTNLGQVWMAEVHGITTVGDPEAFVPALLEMLDSRRTNPAILQRQLQERARSAAQHQANMAMIDQGSARLRANHQQNMATLQNMAASHQAHMASLHESHEAHNAAWRNQQMAQDAAHHARMHTSTSDDSHRRFLNTITEERTVIDGAGNTYQVADGYDRYFRRRSDGAWIGTRDHRGLNDIPGVNPDDYEEVKIKR